MDKRRIRMMRTVNVMFVSILAVVLTVISSGGLYAMMGTGAGMPGMTGNYQTTTMTGNNQGTPMMSEYQDETMMGGSGTQFNMGSYGTMMGSYGAMMGAMMNGRFKLADMTGDGIPEIVTMMNNVVVMMNGAGEVIAEKEVEGVKELEGVNRYMNRLMTRYTGEPWHMGGTMAVLDVADMNGDGVSEIVIMDLEKIMVFDNTIEMLYTTPLPWMSTSGE
jgi:hypothetical protein